MKTKILFIVAAVLTSSLIFAQAPQTSSAEKCKEKVLKKIKRTMVLVDFQEHVPLGQTKKLILSCDLNEDNYVEIKEIKGAGTDFEKAIMQTLEKHPVKCDEISSNQSFPADSNQAVESMVRLLNSISKPLNPLISKNGLKRGLTRGQYR